MVLLPRKTLMVTKSQEFDEWQAIHQSFPFQSFPCECFSYEGYNKFVKVLCVKLSNMFDSSNFVRLFYHQSFVLYGIGNFSYYCVLTALTYM